jgi:cold shock CspA family protein
MKPERKIGTIKFWNERRGYGFVTTDDYRDLFLHASQWVENDEPRKGERVSFIEDVGRDQKPFARQATRD